MTKATGALANLLGTSGDQELKGSGTIGRTTVISTTLGTRVVHVLPNGYLVVEGVKEIRVSSEQQVITVRGVVRPADLGPNNVVQSDLIAQLEVSVNGKGCGGRRHQAPVHSVPAAAGTASVLRLEQITMRWMAFCLLAAVLAAPGSCATRLKDLAGIEGVRDNQLIGYGLVVGLAGKGDTQQTLFSPQSLANMLERMGVSVPGSHHPDQGHGGRHDHGHPASVRAAGHTPGCHRGRHRGRHQPPGRDTAADAAERPPTARSTRWRRVPLVTGGFIGRTGGSSQTVNHPTVGRVPGGAIVERPAPSLAPKGVVHLQLRYADFTTASRIAAALNAKYGAAGALPARAENSALVSVLIPKSYADPPDRFHRGDGSAHGGRGPARPRGGERAHRHHRHGPRCAYFAGGYPARQSDRRDPDQRGRLAAAPLSAGTTAAQRKWVWTPRSSPPAMCCCTQGATVEELVRALAAIGSTPRDVIAILQNLRAAGALDAELEVI